MDGIKKMFEKIEEEKEHMIDLSMFGVKIPLDDQLKKAIRENIRRVMNSIVKDDKSMKDLIAHSLLINRKFLMLHLKPIIRDILEDSEFIATLELRAD